ncbi:MAG TPA: HAMP domain-containing sensor histidine kinase [Ginsengibacter sp.]|nr:HAMP domain-containing histidine kinase [Chitinophagaceae bacterium]HRP44760.1 HAMP domain-containing sensor histidine kinase [Ginsengibacter sp.]
MKKIFPAISVLIFLSVIGIIILQIMWTKQSFRDKQIKFAETAKMVAYNSASDLVELHAKGFPLSSRRNSDLLLPLNIFSNSIAGNFSVAEVNAVLEKNFKKYGLEHADYEFAISSMAMMGDELQSENFLKMYEDTIAHPSLSIIIPLTPPGGSLMEGLTPEELLTIVIPEKSMDMVVWRNMYWLIFGTAALSLIIFAAFFVTFRALLNQKKLSEIKSDFINNMTHEFKTPLATISLAVDALRNEKVMNDKSKLEYFSGIIKDENKRMNKQVESILQAALLDRQQMELDLKRGHAHDLIKNAVNNIRLLVEERGGTIEMELNAKNDCILMEEVHFGNIIHNLLDNAMKYSKEHPRIKVFTSNTSNTFRVRVQDNGIGMTKETAQRIFEKFYRAHTGNLHNVKGFGLGLAYVKSIVEGHNGKIKVESTPGKGSSFILDFPSQKALVTV